jgi:hypothetical protein
MEHCHVMSPGCGGRKSLQILRIAAKLNKKLQRADKETSLGGAFSSNSPLKKKVPYLLKYKMKIVS